MKRIDRKTILFVLITLVTGLFAGWLIFGGTSEPVSADYANEHDHASETGEATTWTCSMHPQIRQPEEGDCPICGMDLIPLENDDNADTDPLAIRMSPAAMQLASVSTSMPMEMQPVKEVRLNGKVAADERLIYSQSSHIPGRIERLHVNFTGEFIQQGQTIATVYSPDLVTAQEELFEAYKIRESQPGLFEASREKLTNWKLTEDQIDDILAAGSARQNFPVQAEISGYVAKKMVHLGDYIDRGETLYEIADLSMVWVMFYLYETDLPWVSVNDQVEFTVQSLPGETFEGKISYIDPVIDPRTRVAKARVAMKNPGGELKPQMFVSGTVEARLEGAGEALVIPETAVMWTGKRSVVFVKQSTDQGISFRMREITLGPSLGDSYIVQYGLDMTEEIAVNGTFSIDAAAQLAGKPSMMNPEGGTVMTGHDHGGGADITGQNHEVHTQMEMTPEKAVNTSKATISDAARAELEPMYNSYLELTEALANDNFDNATAAGIAMKDALGNVNMGVFENDAHHIWMDHAANLEKAIEHVGHYGSIEELRSAYRGISDAMIALTRSFGSPGEPLYLQYCPMANNDKGANWLSNYNEIRNPYFGDMMLKCGETQDTIE